MARTLWTHIRHDGWRATVDAILWQLAPTVFQVWERKLGVIPLLTLPAGISLLSAADTFAELKRLRQSAPMLSAEFYRDATSGAGWCLVALVDGQPAGIAWLYDQTVPGHFLKMFAGDVELRSVYTRPEFRCRGVAKILIAKACQHLHDKGFKRVYAVVHESNEPSLKAFRASGFQKVAAVSRPAIYTLFTRHPIWRTNNN
jgi:ribosomal protein S18 acetylase RimI-like enzyme